MTSIGVLMAMKKEEEKGQEKEKQTGSSTFWRGSVGTSTEENSLSNTSRDGKANDACF